MESVTGQSLRELQEKQNDTQEVMCSFCGNPCGIYVIRLLGGVSCNHCFKSDQLDFSASDFRASPYKARAWRR
jgi:hypothetical protein